jgi:hypothetical protein
MKRIILSFKDVLAKSSDSDIQKYNGKSVSISSSFEPLFSESNVLALFRVSPFRTADDVKLRSLLKSKGIHVLRFNSRQLKLFKRLVYGMYSLEHINFIFQDLGFVNFFRFMEGSVILLEFDDLDHFLFFEKFLILKLEKYRLSFISLKVNNQYFSASSSFLKTALISVKSLDYNLSRIKNFSFFQFVTIRSFLYFFILMKYQTEFLNRKYKLS